MICTPFSGQTRERGIFMRYTYDFKVECVELYRQGKWKETPEGVNTKRFRKYIYNWFKISEKFGIEYLRHRDSNRQWTAEERFELVAQVLAGKSVTRTARDAGLNAGQLYQWVRKYKIERYEGLVNKKAGRKPLGGPTVPKSEKSEDLTPSEREEMLRLKSENEVLRAEIEAIKKSIALSRKRWDEQLKAKKQRLSKNSKNKDIH